MCTSCVLIAIAGVISLLIMVIFGLKIETWSNGQSILERISMHVFDLKLVDSHQYILDCVDILGAICHELQTWTSGFEQINDANVLGLSP